jgi:hypothetical protein
LDTDTLEEYGRWHFKDIKNVSFNVKYNYFQFTTSFNVLNVESYTFKTKQCSELFEQTKLLLEQNLRDHNVDNFKNLIKKATHVIESTPRKIGVTQEIKKKNNRKEKRLKDLIENPDEDFPDTTRTRSNTEVEREVNEDVEIIEKKPKSARTPSEEKKKKKVGEKIKVKKDKSYKRAESAIFNPKKKDSEGFAVSIPESKEDSIWFKKGRENANMMPIIELEDC